MYFARSLPFIFDHVVSYAARAARTASSTSAAFASATSESFASDAGSIVSKYLPDRGARHAPPMNRS